MSAIKKQGRGTGTVRRQRFDRMTETWSPCHHFCPSTHWSLVRGARGKKHWIAAQVIWQHKIPAEFSCHLPIFYSCAECLEMDTGFGVLMRTATKGAKQ